MKNLRIIPVTIIAMMLVVGLKIGAVWDNTRGLLIELDVAEVAAKEDKKEEEGKEKKATDEGMAAEEASDNEGSDTKTITSVNDLSESEIDVLQRLVERRDELTRRKKSLDMRDNLLRATESRIDEKITKLKEIEATIQDLLKAYDDQELKKLKSLVSIYEKMKPKDAARIFNSLDMDVLLDVTGLMKESKLAAILGKMSDVRAKKLTVELATRKQLPGIDKKKS